MQKSWNFLPEPFEKYWMFVNVKKAETDAGR